MRSRERWRGRLAEDLDGARVGTEHVHDHAQGRRLARAVGPEQAEGGAAGHGERQVLHGDVARNRPCSRRRDGWPLRSRRLAPARASWGRRVYHRASRGDLPAKGVVVAEPSAAPRSFRLGRAGEAARRRAPVRRGPRGDPRRSSSCRRNQEVLREKVEEGHLQPPPAQAIRLRRLDARPRAGGHALVGLLRRLRRARRLRPAVARVARRAGPEVVPGLAARPLPRLRIALRRGRRAGAC